MRSAPVTIEVTPLETMTSGKLCAQVAHAAQLAWQSPLMPDGLRRAWARDGYRVRAVFPDRDRWEFFKSAVKHREARLM